MLKIQMEVIQDSIVQVVYGDIEMNLSDFQLLCKTFNIDENIRNSEERINDSQIIKICECLAFGKDFTISGHPCYEMCITHGKDSIKVWDMDFDDCLAKLCVKYFPFMKEFEKKAIKEIIEKGK